MAEHERFGRKRKRKKKERACEIDCFVKLYEQQDRFYLHSNYRAAKKERKKRCSREKTERKENGD